MIWLYLTIGGSAFVIDSYTRPDVPVLDAILFAILWPLWVIVQLLLFWERASSD